MATTVRRLLEAAAEGAIAQLGERVVRNDEVGGSIPPGSTTLRPSGYAWRSRAEPEGRGVVPGEAQRAKTGFGKIRSCQTSRTERRWRQCGTSILSAAFTFRIRNTPAPAKTRSNALRITTPADQRTPQNTSRGSWFGTAP